MRNDLNSMTSVLDGLIRATPFTHRNENQRTPIGFSKENSIVLDSELFEEPVYNLQETLELRRSTLQYSTEPASTRLILSLLSETLRNDSKKWGLDAELGVLEAFVFVFRSKDLPDGVYRVVAGDCTYIANIDELGPPENLGVQREFSTGAGIVSVYANLDQADDWAGAHGYRVALLRASMATYDFHLRSQSMGYVGTIFGGFIPTSVRNLVNSDGIVRHPLLAVTYALPQ